MNKFIKMVMDKLNVKYLHFYSMYNDVTISDAETPRLGDGPDEHILEEAFVLFISMPDYLKVNLSN